MNEFSAASIEIKTGPRLNIYSPFWRRKAFYPLSAHLGHGGIHFALDSVGLGGQLFWGTGGLKISDHPWQLALPSGNVNNGYGYRSPYGSR